MNLLYPPTCLLCGRPLRSDEEPAPRSDPAKRALALAGDGMSPHAKRDLTEVMASPVGLHEEALFCPRCERGLQPLLPPVCQRCGVGLPGAYDAQMTCARCQRHAFAFTTARAVFAYTGPVREAIHAFKYQGRHRIGRWLASRMARLARESLPVSTVSAVMPVPLHWLKQRLRGMNPPALLADAIAQQLALPYEAHGLRRTRLGPSQTRLTTSQRLRNVEGAFRSRQRLPDATILLVDDVLTSGATAHACAQALREAGASTVIALAAAGTPRP